MKSFSLIVALLTKLTQNKVKFSWLDACEESFEKLKDKVTSAPVLTFPEDTEGFVVYRDASRVGHGCVLIQHSKVVAYASRQVNVYDRNYLTHDLELATKVFALKIWSHYPYVVHVDIYSDPQACSIYLLRRS